MTRKTDEKNLNNVKLEIGEAAKQRGGVAGDQEDDRGDDQEDS